MNTFYQIIRAALKLLLRRGVHSSYSQSGEDIVVRSLFRGKKNGIYVDVGAYHPILYSNTYGLYRHGWRGFVIDPNEAFRPLYRIFRYRDTFIHSGVAEASSSLVYFQFEDGAYNTFDAKVAEEYQRDGRSILLGKSIVQVEPLSAICSAYRVTEIDFLNIDVEGFDIAVLQSHDWSIRPRVISVEDAKFNPDDPNASRIYVFLHEKKYRLVGLTKLNLIFERIDK